MKKDSPPNALMQLLKDKGLSQERFARIADVSLSTAARWIRGRQVPSIAPWRFIALSRELGVSPESLAEAMREACEHPNEKQEDKGDRP
jgi:transcriptional regulator with XRE-family HTH domain